MDPFGNYYMPKMNRIETSRYGYHNFLLAIILGLFAVGCTPYFKAGIDGKYDHSHIYVDAPNKVLDDVIRSVYRIETSTTFKVENNVSTLKIVGMAVSLDEKHLLTAKHVTSIDSYPAQTPFSLLRLPIPPEVKTTETTSIVFDDGSRIPVTVIYRDKEMDFAVLEAEKKIDPPSYPIGNSKEFRITKREFHFLIAQKSIPIQAYSRFNPLSEITRCFYIRIFFVVNP